MAKTSLQLFEETSVTNKNPTSKADLSDSDQLDNLNHYSFISASKCEALLRRDHPRRRSIEIRNWVLPCFYCRAYLLCNYIVNKQLFAIKYHTFSLGLIFTSCSGSVDRKNIIYDRCDHIAGFPFTKA